MRKEFLLSLQEIREKEADLKRRIAEAQNAAQVSLEEAREKAAQLKDEAREEGRKNGQTEAEKLLAETKEEIEQMLEEARNWADGYQKKHRKKIENTVDWAMSIVLGQEGEG